MSNVQNDTSTEPRVLDMSNVEDAILARWEDADEVSHLKTSRGQLRSLKKRRRANWSLKRQKNLTKN